MSVKNVKEDVIHNIVDEIFKSDNELKKMKVNQDEVTAYILNRIPPKYITSERGILHGKLEAKYIIQQKTDILLLLYEAVEVFGKRRPGEVPEDKVKLNESECRFSHIFGEILEESTFTIVPGAEVSLYVNGKLAEMLDFGWKNPYITNKATLGFYHFWPKYSESMGSGSKINFELRFKHDKFDDKSIKIDVDLLETADIGKSHVVPLTLLKIKDGIDSDFLYE